MPQADTFSYGVALWELITKSEETERGNWRPLRVPEECPAEVAALLRDCIQVRRAASASQPLPPSAGYLNCARYAAIVLRSCIVHCAGLRWTMKRHQESLNQGSWGRLSA